MSKGSVAVGVSSTVFNSDLQDMLERKGVDPFEVMADILADADAEPELKLSAAKELAKYMRPQLKSVDIRVAGNVQKTFAVVRFSDVDPTEAAKLAKGLTPAKLLEQIQPSAAVVDHMRKDLEKPAVDGVVTAEAVDDPVRDAVEAEVLEEVAGDDANPGQRFRNYR